MEERSSAVSKQTKQDEEARRRWPHAEPCVWTARMLTALEQGVKGGKWFSLMDKVYAPRTLHTAWLKVKSNKGKAGVDHQSIAMFEKRLDANLAKLSEDLRTGAYRPREIKRVWIPKAGRKGEKRPLGIPTVRDRVAQTALRFALEPIFERDFAEHSYGFRPGRGCKDALRRVNALLDEGKTWVVDADIQGFFDSIPHDRLMERVCDKIADGRTLGLIEACLKQEVLDGLDSWTPDEGTPQGAIISPLLANIYLDPLDHMMADLGFEMVRYADDFVVLCANESDARRALASIRDWVAGVGLTLHPDKTRLVDATQRGGFDFLGYHFERGMRWPSKKSEKRLREAIRPLTKRNNGQCLHSIIADINPKLRGWYEYFKHGKSNTFSTLDGWVRMRLRSIQRKRNKGRGRGRGSDHQRWPNAYFADFGLFSMQTAHKLDCQSARR